MFRYCSIAFWHCNISFRYSGNLREVANGGSACRGRENLLFSLEGRWHEVDWESAVGLTWALPQFSERLVRPLAVALLAAAQALPGSYLASLVCSFAAVVRC